mmetsp:Transcript_11431/g.24647  ORF Transcript_11431/g.24647 Transcript_11431/m.24647 type:complete len:839 (-) Transcript_11431:113-2629(-)
MEKVEPPKTPVSSDVELGSIKSKPLEKKRDASHQYIGHLDGLRAIALVGVLLYHFELLGHTGGFAGVDVFLVISGFLMTRNIASKINAGSFTLPAFYQTRFWRLYPSSLFTVFASLFLSRLILPDKLAAEAAKSGLASMFLSSNILFSREVGGYFDSGAVAKPLLHTWSLSLEEQFYFFWPLLLVSLGASLRRNTKSAALSVAACALFAISFLTCLAVAQRQPVIAWFWLHTRVYEFAVGAIAHVAYDCLPGNAALQTVYAVVGLAGILISYLTLSDATPFPGWASLPSLVGAALVIVTPRATAVAWVLSSPPAKFLAKISYAGYLVHWPLWVFVVFVTGSRSLGWVCMAITIGLAYVQLKVIEEPLRFPAAPPAHAGAASPRASLFSRIRGRGTVVTVLFIASLALVLASVLNTETEDDDLRNLLAADISSPASSSSSSSAAVLDRNADTGDDETDDVLPDPTLTNAADAPTSTKSASSGSSSPSSPSSPSSKSAPSSPSSPSSSSTSAAGGAVAPADKKAELSALASFAGINVPPLSVYLKRTPALAQKKLPPVGENILPVFFREYTTKSEEDDEYKWLKEQSSVLARGMLHYGKQPHLTESPDVVLMGDSFSGNYIYGLFLATRELNLRTVSFTKGGCMYVLDLGPVKPSVAKTDAHQDCVQTQAALRLLLSKMKKPAVVLMAFTWEGKHVWSPDEEYVAHITEMVTWIASFGHDVVLMGSPPHPKDDPLMCLQRRGKLGGPKSCDQWAPPTPLMASDQLLLKNITKTYRAAKGAGSLSHLDLEPVFCTEPTRCRVIDEEENALYRDTAGHLTGHGQLLTIAPLVNMLKSVLKRV